MTEKVYVAAYDCAEHGHEVIGIFSSPEAAERARADSACWATVEEYEIQEIYQTYGERLRLDRIARGVDPETGQIQRR